jgi:hypothetical protein
MPAGESVSRSKARVTISIDTSVLLGYYQSRTGQLGGLGAGASAAVGPPVKKQYAPTPPWDPGAKAARSSALVQQVLAGRSFINEGAAQLDLKGASQDYRKLFALYQGLNALSGLTNVAGDKGATATEKHRAAVEFARGLNEISGYLQSAAFEKIRLVEGAVDATLKAEGDIDTQAPAYVTRPLFAGSSADEVPAFTGPVQFTINVKRGHSTFTVPIDLDGMGATPRSMSNVVKYLNDQLKAQGIFTKFSAQSIPGEPRTIKVNGKDVETGLTGPTRWALKVETDSVEQVSFSAAPISTAVYITQAAGDPNPDGDPTTDDGAVVQQLVKFQTAGALPERRPGEANYVAGRLFEQGLGDNVGAVHASAVGADGSVYVLADVTGETDGQSIRGDQDVALLKYDSAGQLIYTRTLGAKDSATGMALSVSADGKVAIAGSVTGRLLETENVADASTPDSFVTVFDATGDEMWTQRRAARAGDAATAVAFAADGSVFVAGTASSSVPGASAVGGQDSYLMGFSATGAARFTTQFGTSGADKLAGLVVDGDSVVVAGTENGRGVLRRFDIPATGAPTLAATRDLGDLQGGSITGLAIDGGQVVIAGSTRNTALDAGTISRAHAGGYDAFAARLDVSLGAAASDALAYYGGTGDDKAAGLAVAAGQVWLTGAAGADLPNGLGPVGKRDGFVASLDVASGQIGWSQRFSGNDRMATPSSITVDPGGASVLDRLGLPTGEINPLQSQNVISQTSLRPGDQFRLSTGDGLPPKTVTIEARDTFDDLLAKIRRALNFTAEVSLVSDPASPGVKHLQIKPLNQRSTPQVLPGPDGRDALGALGLTPGVARNTTTINGTIMPADGRGQIYGLGLPAELNLSSPEAIKAAADALSKALNTVTRAYNDLRTAAMPQSASTSPTHGKTGGPVPAYLKNQIANYTAALNRLTGGG